MSTTNVEKYNCDNCGKSLSDSRNSLDICTSKSEGALWRRLHVKIQHISGFHNDATTEDADLCRGCAVALLADALKRVKAGERATAGTESTEREGWNR
jgi:hypothetical protein